MLILLAVGASAASYRVFRGGEALLRARDAVADGDGEALRAAVGRGLEWNPREPELYSLRAVVRVRDGNLDQARDDLRRAVRLAPGSARFRAESGEVALLLGSRAEAVRQYEDASRLLPLNKDFVGRLEELRRAAAN